MFINTEKIKCKILTETEYRDPPEKVNITDNRVRVTLDISKNNWNMLQKFIKKDENTD